MAEPTRSASARGKSARIRRIQQASLIYRKLFRWRQTYIVLSPQNPNHPIWGVNLPPKRGRPRRSPRRGRFGSCPKREWPTIPSVRLERRRSPPQGWLRRSQSPGQCRLRPQGRRAQSGFRLDIGEDASSGPPLRTYQITPYPPTHFDLPQCLPPRLATACNLASSDGLPLGDEA